MGVEPTTFPTLDEVREQLRLDDAAIKQAGRRLTETEAIFQRMTNRLTYGSEEAWRASFQEYTPALEAAETEAAETAGRIAARARQAMQVAEREALRLSDDEQARAASHAAFVREDAERLPYTGILERISAALLANDKPLMWLWHRYARMRLAAGDEGVLDPEQARAKNSIGTGLRVIEGRLTPGDLRRANERASDLLSTALQLERRATQRRQQERRFRFQQPGDVAW